MPLPHYAIATGRSSLSISFKPSFPGLAVRVTGLRGEFEATIDADGSIDWSRPTGGRFELRVADLSLGNRLVTMGATRWLDPARFDRITGELLEVRPAGGDRFESRERICLKDLDVTLAANGRFEIERAERVTVHGRTFADPRQFGVFLPPFLNFMVHVRWKIALEPAPSPDSPHTPGAEISTET